MCVYTRYDFKIRSSTRTHSLQIVNVNVAVLDAQARVIELKSGDEKEY